MNRRGFLASLFLIPAALKAVVLNPPAPKWIAVGVSPPGAWNLDEVFKQLYAVRRSQQYQEIDCWMDAKTAEAMKSVMRKYYADRYGVTV